MRWAVVAIVASCAGVAHADSVGQIAARPDERRARVFGVMADAGVPDGANAALVLRPSPWLRLNGGGGTNSVSGGVRGGVSLIPFGVGPSFNVDVGHYWAGEASGFVRRFTGIDRYPLADSLLRRVAYVYGNAQVGLELGSRAFTFFIHGGVSYLRGRVHDAQEAVDANRTPRSIARGTTVTVNQDPILRVVAPSAKLGIVVYVP